MQTIVIRGNKFETIREVHEYLADELCFPDYYGKNLDALYDVLTDLPEEEEILFLVLFAKNMKKDLSGKLEKMIRVFRDAAEENPRLQVIVADEREEQED